MASQAPLRMQVRNDFFLLTSRMGLFRLHPNPTHTALTTLAPVPPRIHPHSLTQSFHFQPIIANMVAFKSLAAFALLAVFAQASQHFERAPVGPFLQPDPSPNVQRRRPPHPKPPRPRRLTSPAPATRSARAASSTRPPPTAPASTKSRDFARVFARPSGLTAWRQQLRQVYLRPHREQGRRPQEHDRPGRRRLRRLQGHPGRVFVHSLRLD
jgi:hypothetical protein